MEDRLPSISVVMPLYNKETDVSRAVQSVLSQTFSDFELVVVNDGSTDTGPQVVGRIKDPRIHLVHQENAGVSAARNRGITEAKGDLIAFIDADDEWQVDFLKTIIRLRNRFPACSVFATSYFFRQEQDFPRPAVIRGLDEKFEEGPLRDYFDIAARSDPPLWSSAIAVTKNAITSIGGFPLGVKAGEDLITWARLALKYNIAYSRVAKAHFWKPVKVTDRPGRVPQIPDIVGAELGRLITEAESSKVSGLKAYTALWHRMRAVIFIQLGERRQALHDLRKAMTYSTHIKLYVIFLIALMPCKLPATVFSLFKRFRDRLIGSAV